ncbi:MAG: tetratricopeptide repeat protein [Coriobacteriia bacterium]|nr:tetratricopeptide repeat protein [Coriobacteriia bacterium]
MDQTRFQEAQQAYDAGDFRTAAKGFLAAAGRGPDGNGAAYHMAGNALMRLRRHQDAVTVYGHALRDTLYDRRGAVWSNLGAAYCELGEYAEAAKAYEEAINEVDYATPYKAHQGMAGALLERGRVEEAAIAYRKAALDASNPDPGKALVNLGLCFMGLGRPADAVEAYRAALGFEEYKGRGKALANMGQAYVALGEYAEAVRSFEKATQLHNHTLSPSAQAAYDIALAQVKPAEQPVEPVATAAAATASRVAAASMSEASAGELTDSWSIPVHPVAAADAPPSFVDFGEEFAHSSQLTQPLVPFDQIVDPTAELGMGDESAVADFFSATDEQLKARDKEARRAERHERGPFAVWRTVGVAVVVILLVVAALVATYEMGFGWPTQAQTVGGVLSAYETGGAVDSFWVAAPSKDVAKEMAKIPPMKGYEIGPIARGATTSTVAVTVTPKTGAALHYTITLSREGVGWKVSGVDNDWSSTGG